MKYLLSILILIITTCYSNAENKSNIDYFFVFNGGVFIHEEGKPIENFNHFAIPESKTYSDKVQICDITPQGDLICVLRGIREEDDKIDLVRITSSKAIIPLFSIQKREELRDGRKKDRIFGDLDYDASNERAVFTVIERLSPKGGVLEGGAEYYSKVYQIPIKGGACVLIHEYNGVIDDVCAAAGRIGIIEKPTPESFELAKFSISKSSSDKEFFPVKITGGNLLSVDLSPDGKELLTLEKIAMGAKPYKLSRIQLGEKDINEKKLIKEWSEFDLETGHRYSANGKYILYSQKRKMHWGENNLTFLMTNSEVYPLIRDDFASSYNPLPKPKNIDEIEKILVTPQIIQADKVSDSQHTIAAIKCGSQPFLFELNNDGECAILNYEFKKMDEFQISEYGNSVKGIYIDENKWLALTELNLGERLISFESVKYGTLYEKTIGGDDVSVHDLRLSWNIGGRLVGLKVPDNEIFIGGDDDYLHMVLNYPNKGIYPPSEKVTPFYLLNRKDWIIERSYRLGNYKTDSHYFVRSASDKNKNIYLLDSLKSRIIKYDANLKKSEMGWLPVNLAPLAYPSDMLLMKDKIWINDPLNKRVIVFSVDGIPLKIINLDYDPSTSMDSSRFLYVDDKNFSLINMRNLTILKCHFK